MKIELKAKYFLIPKVSRNPSGWWTEEEETLKLDQRNLDPLKDRS